MTDRYARWPERRGERDGGFAEPGQANGERESSRDRRGCVSSQRYSDEADL